MPSSLTSMPPSRRSRTTPRRWGFPLTPRRRSTRGNTRGGEKCRADSDGQTPKGLDHDPPAKTKWTPFGVLVLATGALMLIFGAGETSDFWVDALLLWWERVRPQYGHIRRLVIFLDNGPNNAGTRTQFLK